MLVALRQLALLNKLSFAAMMTPSSKAQKVSISMQFMNNLLNANSIYDLIGKATFRNLGKLLPPLVSYQGIYQGFWLESTGLFWTAVDDKST